MLQSPDIFKIIFEGLPGTGRSEYVRDAAHAYAPEELTTFVDTGTILKNLIGFSSIATYAYGPEFRRVVVIDDAEEWIENRGHQTNLLQFLTSVTIECKLKVILILPPMSRKNIIARKKILERCHATAKMPKRPVINTDNLTRVHDVIMASLSHVPVSGANLEFLVAKRSSAYDTLNIMITAKFTSCYVKNNKKNIEKYWQYLIDAAYIDSSYFDEVSNNMSATLKVLAMLDALKVKACGIKEYD